MSKYLSNAAVIDFDSEVKHAYQGTRSLRDTVTTRTGVTGESYKFAAMGKGLANQKATQADVTPMDINYSRPTANLENWNAPEYTDIFDQAEVNFDEKSELAGTIAAAIGRREDQLIIDAMNAGTYSATPGTDNTVGLLIDLGATNALTVAALRQASTKGLTKRGVNGMDRHIVLTADALDQLLATTAVTSSDYNAVKTLVNGDIDTFLGFKFHVIEQREEGGLPGDGTTSSASFCYHKKAVGIAIGIDLKTTVDWIAQKTSWLCNGIMKGGAVIRENSGVVKILSDSTIVVAQP